MTEQVEALATPGDHLLHSVCQVVGVLAPRLPGGRWRRSTAAVAAAVLAATIAPSARAEAPAALASEAVVIGIVSTLDHPAWPTGADLAPAVAASVERQLGVRGRLLGREVRLLPVTDDCTRTSAEAAARQLVEAKAAVVIGHVCAAAAMSAAAIYAAVGTLFVAVGVRHPRLTDKRAGPFVFRMAGRTDRAARDIARHASARHAGAKVAILHDRSAEARALAADVEKALAASKPVRLDFVSGERSYRDITGRLAAAEIGVIVSPAQPVELGIVLDELDRAGRRPDAILAEAHAVPDIEPVAARHGARLRLMLPWPALPGGTSGDRSRAAEHLAVLAAKAWLGAVRRAGSTEPAAVASALVEPIGDGGKGLAFDADGDVVAPSYVPHRWSDGRWIAE